MNVTKQPGSVSRHTAAAEDMALINALAKTTLKPDEVYTFAVRLCDNEIDRDLECFDLAALEQLRELFVGKSGIFDHNWSALGQTARLYKTELCPGEGICRSGEACWYLKGYAYMLRSEKNRELIAEIEGGIKKEVSIGCSVARSVCSICGQESCSHQRGALYDGRLCYFTLQDPVDAYEWSFVAVPAQRRAGVMKAFAGTPVNLKSLLADHKEALAQLETLEKEAAMGRSYLQGLRRELIRLAGTADAELDTALFAGVAEKLEERELLELTKVYQHRIDKQFPQIPQLGRGAEPCGSGDEDGAFLI